MNKAKINYFVDLGMGLAFISAFITGLIKFPNFIRLFGVRYGQLPIREISLLHDWSGLVMGLLALTHIILHWNFILNMTKSFFKKSENK